MQPALRDLQYALDPARLLGSIVGGSADPWQARLLRSSAPRVLLNCCRQSGKSTTAGVVAIHTAAYTPNSLVLLLSPSLRQSKELFRKALSAYRWVAPGAPLIQESTLQLEFANGSRIVSLPGAEHTIRGFSGVRLLIVDEAAFVEDGLYRAVRPMLAVSGGRLLALSTPCGARGWWYDAWAGEEPWERYAVPAPECPRISPAFLEEERRALGIWYAQEYELAFLDAVNAVFTREMIDSLHAPAMPVLDDRGVWS